jgi:hypothetical protein
MGSQLSVLERGARMGYSRGYSAQPNRRLTRSVGAPDGYGGTRGVLKGYSRGTRQGLSLPSPRQGAEGVLEYSQGRSVHSGWWGPPGRACGDEQPRHLDVAVPVATAGYSDYKRCRTWRAYNRNHRPHRCITRITDGIIRSCNHYKELQPGLTQMNVESRIPNGPPIIRDYKGL